MRALRAGECSYHVIYYARGKLFLLSFQLTNSNCSVSLGFRRPSMLRFSNWMAESLKELETSPDAAPTDKRLAAWVKLQRIMEASSSAFSTDDPSAGITLADPRIQLTLKSFEKQLENWKFNLPSNIMNGILHPPRRS